MENYAGLLVMNSFCGSEIFKESALLIFILISEVVRTVFSILKN